MPDTLELDVEVTWEDLENGLSCNCSECPGALAINRAVAKALGDDTAYRSMVSNSGVHVWPAGTLDWANFRRLVAIPAPEELRELVRRVDTPAIYGEASPVKFHLSLLWRP